MKKKQLVISAVFAALLVSIILPSAALAGGWHTNIEITDIYPGRQPHGQFWFRITNHGPGNMVNVRVRVTCESIKLNKHYSNAMWMADQNKVSIVIVTLQPGQTQAFPSGVSLDSNTFMYDVSCTITAAPWEDGGPNWYTEFVP